jgi:cell division protein FtsQ
VVEGEFHFITKKRATELLAREIDGDFIQLDLMRLKNALLSDSWVETVNLNRRWPDTLVVKILEQKPIARWGDGFLNQRGEIVRVDDMKKLTGLPWLQGNEKNAVEILQQYQDLSQLLRSRGLEVVALKCDDKKSWRLTVKNDIEIAIGRDQVMEKMRRFVTVYDTHLSSVWDDVTAIDVRYTNGIAVRWKIASIAAEKYKKYQTSVPNTLGTP